MYKCLTKTRYDAPLSKSLSESVSKYALVPIRKEDMEAIRIWRNGQIPILRQNHEISKEEQERYFTSVLLPSFSEQKPKQILFSILENDNCIGYGALVHIDWYAKHAEISFLLDTEIKEESAHFKECFFEFLKVIQGVAFGELGLHRLIAECYEVRAELMALLGQFGFEKEGTLRDHVFKNGRFHNAYLFSYLAKSNTKASVLVTSISKKVPLVCAVKNALQKSSKFNTLYGADCSNHVPAKFYVDHFWHCPKEDALTVDALIGFCKQNNIQAIIPTRDGELAFFAKAKNKLLEAGIQVMVSGYDAIQLLSDKNAFSEYLKDNKFPAIDTFLALDDCRADSLVVKSRTGAKDRAIGLKLTQKEAEVFAKKISDPIFQPYIVGQEYSVDLYIEKNGKVKGCVARRRELVVQGESQITTTVSLPKLEKLACTLAEKLAKDVGLSHHVMFQVIEDAKKELFIVECNARFGGASTASIAVGLDSFYWFLQENTCENLSFRRLSSQVCQVRAPHDKLINMV